MLVLACIIFVSLAPAHADELRVHLIGTGGPELTPDRAGISTLVDANGRKFLFDVGRGAHERQHNDNAREAGHQEDD